MNILLLSAVYPPNIIGGAEVSAQNLARALVKRGHTVGVLTMAEPDAPEMWNQADEDGVRMFRLHYPRKRTTYGANRRALGRMEWKIWHLQDYFDPRPLPAVRKILDLLQPDFINIHGLDGLGFNLLPLFARRRIPVNFVLHDLSLVCTMSTMFKNGNNCVGQCLRCRIVGRMKRACLSRVGDLSFISPSKANLDTVKRYLPLASERPNFVIRNIPDALPDLPAYRPDVSGKIRLLFAGRISSEKGLHIALEALRPLAAEYPFHVTVCGRGDQEDELKTAYGEEPWVAFEGHVEKNRVLECLAQSDAMLVPSLWAENWSGSVVQSLRLGVPVIGSRVGGIPEQVRDRVTGLLLPPGDVAAWREALASVAANPGLLRDWRANAEKYAHEFDADTIATHYEDTMTHLVAAAAANR